MLSVIYAHCRKIGVHAECHYAECRGTTNIRLGCKRFPGPNIYTITNKLRISIYTSMTSFSETQTLSACASTL
jgi:hypothetical protein